MGAPGERDSTASKDGLLSAVVCSVPILTDAAGGLHCTIGLIVARTRPRRGWPRPAPLILSGPSKKMANRCGSFPKRAGQ